MKKVFGWSLFVVLLFGMLVGCGKLTKPAEGAELDIAPAAEATAPIAPAPIAVNDVSSTDETDCENTKVPVQKRRPIMEIKLAEWTEASIPEADCPDETDTNVTEKSEDNASGLKSLDNTPQEENAEAKQVPTADGLDKAEYQEKPAERKEQADKNSEPEFEEDPFLDPNAGDGEETVEGNGIIMVEFMDGRSFWDIINDPDNEIIGY